MKVISDEYSRKLLWIKDFSVVGEAFLAFTILFSPPELLLHFPFASSNDNEVKVDLFPWIDQSVSSDADSSVSPCHNFSCFTQLFAHISHYQALL